MAEQFLEEIYQYANVVSELRYIVETIREHDDHHAIMTLNSILPDICALCEKCIELQYDDGIVLWKQVQDLTKIQNDLILLGDIIENAILPMMEKWIQSLADICQQADEEYWLESTACGFLTIKNTRTNMYLHSNNNPMEEARKLVESCYDPKVEHYSVYGCGLGYHVYELYRISNGSVSIKLYDVNDNMIEYAKHYGVLEWIPQDKLEIIVDRSVLPFLESIDNVETGVLFHLPSMRQIQDTVEREALLGIYVQQSTVYKFDKDVQINFWRNVSSGIEDISKMQDTTLKKEMVIVAAGPSLDDRIELLRSWKNKKTIVAVGTVFKKMIKQGIRPDYVVVMDPQKRTIKQLEGVENENIPLIIDRTAYWEFAHLYQGPKYMVCTPSGKTIITDYAREHNLTLWNGGGTVTSMALEFAIHFGARKIYFVGVDLAYPAGVSHAIDTMDFSVRNTEGMSLICGVNGSLVYADRIFISYREWIEKRIAQTKEIVYYNMSTKGAHIEGTIAGSEEDNLEDSTEDIENYLYEKIYARLFYIEKLSNYGNQQAYQEELINDIMQVGVKPFMESYKKRLANNPKQYIHLLSILYALTEEKVILYSILEVLEDDKIDCLLAETVRKQVMSNIFTSADVIVPYCEERHINEVLSKKWVKENGNRFSYIPFEKRKKNSILVMTDQFLSIRHAPTALVVQMIICLMDLGFEVHLLINVANDEKGLGEVWWNPVHFNVWEKAYGSGFLEFDKYRIPYMQVNYAERLEESIDMVGSYLDTVKPEFVWHIGGTLFIADEIGRSATMIATKCTDGYAVSEADVLASYMASSSEYVLKSLQYIEDNKQQHCRFLPPNVKEHELVGENYTREQYGLPQDKFIICLVGNRLKKEISETFIAWMLDLVQRTNKVFFVTIGEKIGESKFENNILQLGYQNELADVLKLCDLFVNPPRKGAGGGAVCAMAAGIPAITLGECDVANVVPESFIVRDLEDMKETVIRCLDDAQYYEEMCKKASEQYKRIRERSESGEVQRALAEMINKIRVWAEQGMIK